MSTNVGTYRNGYVSQKAYLYSLKASNIFEQSLHVYDVNVIIAVSRVVINER